MVQCVDDASENPGLRPGVEAHPGELHHPTEAIRNNLV